MKCSVFWVLAMVVFYLDQSDASLKKLFKKLHKEEPECEVHWEEVTEPYCTTTYDKKCELEYREECKTEHTEECKTEYKEECKTEYTQHCETEYEEQCVTENTNECWEEEEKDCKSEPKCHTAYEQMCSTTYRRVCSLELEEEADQEDEQKKVRKSKRASVALEEVKKMSPRDLLDLAHDVSKSEEHVDDNDDVGEASPGRHKRFVGGLIALKFVKKFLGDEKKKKSKREAYVGYEEHAGDNDEVGEPSPDRHKRFVGGLIGLKFVKKFLGDEKKKKSKREAYVDPGAEVASLEHGALNEDGEASPDRKKRFVGGIIALKFVKKFLDGEKKNKSKREANQEPETAVALEEIKKRSVMEILNITQSASGSDELVNENVIGDANPARKKRFASHITMNYITDLLAGYGGEECHDVPQKQCVNVPVEKCHDVQTCQYKPTTKCQEVPHQKCWQEPQEKCVEEPHEKCWQEHQEKCWQEPHEKCWQEPHEVCEDVPEEKCEYVKVKVAKDGCKRTRRKRELFDEELFDTKIKFLLDLIVETGYFEKGIAFGLLD